MTVSALYQPHTTLIKLYQLEVHISVIYEADMARAVLPDMRACAARPKQTNGYSASRHMWAVNVNICVVKSAPENEFKTSKAASLSAEFKTLKVPDPPET